MSLSSCINMHWDAYGVSDWRGLGTESMKLECSPEAPWGIHPALRNDEDCPRCGWTAPGPKGDARADAARQIATLGLALIDCGKAQTAAGTAEVRAAA